MWSSTAVRVRSSPEIAPSRTRAGEVGAGTASASPSFWEFAASGSSSDPSAARGVKRLVANHRHRVSLVEIAAIEAMGEAPIGREHRDASVVNEMLAHWQDVDVEQLGDFTGRLCVPA